MTEADSGEHKLDVWNFGGAIYVIDANSKLMTHPLEKGAKANVVVKYEGNGTVISGQELISRAGSNSLNFIDGFMDPGVTPLAWAVGTASTPVNWSTAGDVSLTLTVSAFQNYNGGTFTNGFSLATYADSGPMRDYT